MSAHEDLLQRLDLVREAGFLRALDVDLARFVAQHSAPSAGPWVLATALLSRAESLGHVCLNLNELRRDPAAVLAWPVERVEEFQAELALLPPDAKAAHQAGGTPPPLLAAIGRAEADPQTPLVLGGERLYLRRYWAMERRVVAQVRQRAEPWPATAEAAFQARSISWLARLFGDTEASDERSPDWQRVACERALQAGFTLVTGGPGTGKTYTAARLLVALLATHAGAQPLRVGLAAPTGKAAARLRSSIDQGLQTLRQDSSVDAVLQRAGPVVSAGTLHALLGVQPGTRRFAHHAGRLLPLDVLVVDEASMVHLELFDALLQALPATARLVLLGDSEQLSSVEAGSVVGDLCAATQESKVWRQTVKLRETRRFSGTLGDLARAANAGDAAALLALLTKPPDGSVRQASLVLAARGGGAGAVAALEVARLALGSSTSPLANPDDKGAASADGLGLGHAQWLQRLKQGPSQRALFVTWALELIRGFERFRVLCALREGPRGVAGINEATEREALARGWIQKRGVWYEGRPIMVTRNDSGLGLFNGDTGLVLRSPAAAGSEDGGFRAFFANGDTLRSVSVSRLPEVETAFAMTVHKSQGSEFDRVMLVLPDDDLPVLTRELLYTGITRARRQLTLAYASESTLAQALGRRTWRMSGLRF